MSNPMDVAQALMFLLLTAKLDGVSAFAGCSGPAPSLEEVDPLADDVPESAETSSVAPAAPTIHLPTPFNWTMSSTVLDPNLPLNVKCRFAAKFVAKSGRPVKCTVELMQVGFNRRRLRITKSDTKAVLVDCELDRKSKMKVVARTNVKVLAETKEGSGHLAICSLAFATADEAWTFVGPFP
jgi:hypothetical protein